MGSELSEARLAAAVNRAEERGKVFPGREREVFTAVLLWELLCAGQEPNVIEAGRRVPRKAVSIGEVFQEKDPGSEPEKAVVCGFYLEQQGLSCFNVDDLGKAFVTAKEKVPGNLNDVMNKAIKKGWAMEVPEGKDGKKAWCLTRSGEEVVRAGFTRKG